MAREPLRALDEDVDRTIAAGVGGVAGDEGLREVQAALGALGQKVPALAKVSEQVGRVLAPAGGRDVAAELLGLTASSRQLRAARAQGPAGAQPAATLAPVEQGSGPLATPLPHAAVVALQQALLAQGPQPVQKLSAAAKSGAVTDLRLLSPAVRALGHKSAALAECVGESVLPLFGAGAAHAIARTFNPKGGAVDVRRLRAYTACAGAGARELLERSFAGGSPEVRACALERIGAVDAKRAEDLALPLLQAKKTAALLQCAAIRALGHSRSEEAFTRISYALDAKAANVRNAAGDALGTSPHPKALDVLLAKLVDKELRFAKYSSPRMKKGMTPAQRQLAYKEARKRNNETAQRAQGKALLVTVLGKRKEKKAGARLRELWKKSSPRWEINRAVFGALYDSKDDGLRKLAFEVAGDARRSSLSWMLVHRVFEDETVDVYDVLGSRIEATNKKATSMAQRVSGMIRTRKEFAGDERWKKWVVGWAMASTWAADSALQTMIAWRMPEAHELVRKKLMAAKPNWQANRLIDAAQRLRLSDVSERIAKLTKLKSGRNVLYSAARFFGAVRDLAVLPLLEDALVAHKKWGKNHYGYKALEKVVLKWRPAAAKLAAKAALKAAKAAKKAGAKAAPVAKKPAAKKPAVKKAAVKKAAAKKPAVKKPVVKKVAAKKKPAAKKAVAAKKKPAAKRAP